MIEPIALKDVPGWMNFNIDFGCSPSMTQARVTKTSALEGQSKNYKLGKEISTQQVEEIDTITSKYGFKLSGIRSYEKYITAELIRRTGCTPRQYSSQHN